MTVRRQLRSDGPVELRFRGGLDERCGMDISIDSCAKGWNFQLDTISGRLAPRLPQDLEGTAPNAGAITGIMQLIDSADTVTQVLVADDTWYKWDGADVYSDITPPLFTSGTSGARMRGTHWVLDDFLAITDLDRENVLYKWDGTTASRLKTTLTVGTAQSVTVLDSSGSTASATVSAHGYANGDLVTIAGATPAAYNGEYQISNVAADTFDYTFAGGATPASGTITADKGVELKAKYAIPWNNRMWLFNITADGTATPHMALVSAFEDPEDYDNSSRGHAQGGTGLAASDAFYLLSPDGRPINGAVSFYDTLVLSTAEGRLFKVTGSDATDYQIDEYYPGSSALGDEGIVNTGNDVTFARTGRVVESLVSTDRYGDVSTDDLSKWIPTSVKLMSNPITVYDQEQQKVYLFDDGLSGVLVFDKEFFLSGRSDDTGQLSPWIMYKTNMLNRFSTKCAANIRDPLSTTKTRTVFWGDADGRVYNMNGTLSGGDGGDTSVVTYRKTRIISEMDTVNEVMFGLLEYVRRSVTPIELIFNWGDEYHRETISFNLKASFGLGSPVFWGGDFYWDARTGVDDRAHNYWSSGRVVDDQVSTLSFSVPGKGQNFTLEIQISDTDDFRISRISV